MRSGVRARVVRAVDWGAAPSPCAGTPGGARGSSPAACSPAPGAPGGPATHGHTHTDACMVAALPAGCSCCAQPASHHCAGWHRAHAATARVALTWSYEAGGMVQHLMCGFQSRLRTHPLVWLCSWPGLALAWWGGPQSCNGSATPAHGRQTLTPPLRPRPRPLQRPLQHWPGASSAAAAFRLGRTRARCS